MDGTLNSESPGVHRLRGYHGAASGEGMPSEAKCGTNWALASSRADEEGMHLAILISLRTWYVNVRLPMIGIHRRR